MNNDGRSQDGFIGRLIEENESLLKELKERDERIEVLVARVQHLEEKLDSLSTEMRLASFDIR